MKKFFEPETVALIGASSKEAHPGYQLFLNMRTCFGDRFYPVNPKTAEIDGKTCYPSILDVPAAIDVAVSGEEDEHRGVRVGRPAQPPADGSFDVEECRLIVPQQLDVLGIFCQPAP